MTLAYKGAGGGAVPREGVAGNPTAGERAIGGLGLLVVG